MIPKKDKKAKIRKERFGATRWYDPTCYPAFMAARENDTANV